jgi:hypothetical protein
LLFVQQRFTDKRNAPFRKSLIKKNAGPVWPGIAGARVRSKNSCGDLAGDLEERCHERNPITGDAALTDDYQKM